MNRRQFFYASSAAPFIAPYQSVQTASPHPVNNAGDLLAKAESAKPALQSTPKSPIAIVRPTADPSTFLQWRMDRISEPAALQSRLMRRGDSVILDFGEHLTGHLNFSLVGEGRGVDAPARLKLIFGEVPVEVAQPFDPYKGSLSRAWLQDEVINIDVLPATIRMPRRYAFRYLKIEVVDTSPNYGVRFTSVSAEALSSATGDAPSLPPAIPKSLKSIDTASIATLRDCMQTVFEDGPKRDRRLWIGDMRLQALTNYSTFRNFALVKRCLYLFAAFPREDGLLPACVFEEPKPARGHEYILDYAALYAAAVVEYAQASNDWTAAEELWPAVRRQMEILSSYVNSDNIFVAPPKTWVFFDWSEPLDRTAAMQGAFIYSLGYALELAQKVGASQEITGYTQRIKALTAAAHSAFYDPSLKLFVSGPNRQISYASQAWLVLSGVATQQEAVEALGQVVERKESIKPGGPYLYHYVVDAMLHCGMKEQARALLESYWGGMVKAGADTFWEVYDPANPLLSPYGSVQVNSYCHAWSCTPAYFLRRADFL